MGLGGSSKAYFIFIVKFIYSEIATKFCEMFPLLLIVCTVVKISQNFVAFSECMNFNVPNRAYKDPWQFCTFGNKILTLQMKYYELKEGACMYLVYPVGLDRNRR